METIFNGFLILHIISGFTALFCGIVPMIAKKGGKAHNVSGLIYFWAMFGVFISSLPMAFIKGNVFLFTIGIFSFYFVLTGYRFAKMKGWDRLTIFDKRVMQITFITSIVMISYAAYLFSYGNNQSWIILGIFGFVCFYWSLNDLRKFGKKGKANAWFFSHLQRMIGGYIATSTAFVVTNLTFLPPLIGWLGPGAIGTIGITLTMIHYKRKFRRSTVA